MAKPKATPIPTVTPTPETAPAPTWTGTHNGHQVPTVKATGKVLLPVAAAGSAAQEANEAPDKG